MFVVFKPRHFRTEQAENALIYFNKKIIKII